MSAALKLSRDWTLSFLREVKQYFGFVQVHVRAYPTYDREKR